MTLLDRFSSVMNQDVFPDWCCRVVIESCLVLQKGKSLNIKCMYHNFISLVVFGFPSNIDTRLRVESLWIICFDLIDWNANKLSWLILQIRIKSRPWELRKCVNCNLSTRIRTLYLDIDLWWSPRILYHACDSNMPKFCSCGSRLRRERRRRSRRCMHFELLVKENLEKQATNSSEFI